MHNYYLSSNNLMILFRVIAVQCIKNASNKQSATKYVTLQFFKIIIQWVSLLSFNMYGECNYLKSFVQCVSVK